MASRSMAAEMAWRNSGLRNQAWRAATRGRSLPARPLRLKKRKLYSRAGAEIVEAESGGALALERGVVARADTGDHVGFPGLKADHLRVFAAGDDEDEALEVREARFPVVRIALKHEPLAGDVLLEAEGTEAGDFGGGGVEAPRFGELALEVGLLEEVAGQYRDAVENALSGSVGLRELEDEGMGVLLADVDGLAADDEQVALGGGDFGVQVDAEGEQDVGGVERVAVGEAHAAAEAEGEGAAVARRGPGFGQRGFGAMGFAVDVDEVGHHAADDVAGGAVEGGDGIEGFRLGAQREGEGTAWLLCRRRGQQGHAREECEQAGTGTEHGGRPGLEHCDRFMVLEQHVREEEIGRKYGYQYQCGANHPPIVNQHVVVL